MAGQRLVEPAHRAERRIFTGAAVERVRQGGRDPFGARAVDVGGALRDAGGVGEDFDWEAQVRLTGVDGLVDREVGRNVGSVLVVNRDALRIAFEVALDFETAPVVERIAQHGRVARADPGAVRFALLLAADAEQRRDDGARQRRFAGFVGPVDDVEFRIEVERAVDQLSETIDAQLLELYGAISAASKAATA